MYDVTRLIYIYIIVGKLHEEQGRYEQAEIWYKASTLLNEELLGSYDPNTLNSKWIKKGDDEYLL
jgi:hypothetical protein